MTNSVWQAPIQNATGDIVIGAEITVIDEGTGLNATLFSTRGGAALTNPFFSDANGFAQFYAGPGEYRIEALDNGTGLTQTLRYVRLGDSGSVDTQTSSSDSTEGSAMLVGGAGWLISSGGYSGDADTIVNRAVYSTGLNKPNNTNAMVIDVTGGPGVGDSDYGFQIGGRGALGTPLIRLKEAGSFGDWLQIYTDFNYQPGVLSNPIGVVKFMINKTGGNVSNGAIVEGVDLEQARGNAAGAILSSGITGLAGQFWKAVGGYTTLVDSAGLFVRET